MEADSLQPRIAFQEARQAQAVHWLGGGIVPVEHPGLGIAKEGGSVVAVSGAGQQIAGDDVQAYQPLLRRSPRQRLGRSGVVSVFAGRFLGRGLVVGSLPRLVDAHSGGHRDDGQRQ